MGAAFLLQSSMGGYTNARQFDGPVNKRRPFVFQYLDAVIASSEDGASWPAQGKRADRRWALLLRLLFAFVGNVNGYGYAHHRHRDKATSKKTHWTLCTKGFAFAQCQQENERSNFIFLLLAIHRVLHLSPAPYTQKAEKGEPYPTWSQTGSRAYN